MGLFRSSQSPREKFAQQVLDAVVATRLADWAHYDERDFAIVYRRHGDGEESGRIYLHNTFHETADLGRRARARRIRQLVTITVEAPSRADTWDEAKPNLRPVIRGASYGLAVPGATTVDNPLRMLSRPVLPFLVEFVVRDEPTSIAFVTQARLDEWGVTEDEVFAVARQNLEGLAAGIPVEPHADGRPAMLHFADSGDGYFTSMLLVEGFLARLALRVGGPPVAFVPDKDTLFVVSDLPEALPGIYQMIEKQYQAATRCLSPVAYTVDSAGRVVPYRAKVGSELARLAHRAELVLAGGEYAAQKEVLDAEHERDGVDIFVGSLLVAGRPDESLFSAAVWSNGVDTLLPEADYVAFQPGDGPGEAITVPFDVVLREASLIPEPGYSPLRYRVTAWPGATVMDRLRAQAVTP